MMNPKDVLNVSRLPARLNAEQTAELLGCCDHDIPVLIKASILKPLGNPVANATKYFSSADLEQKLDDPKWVDKMTRALYERWKSKSSQGTREKPGTAGHPGKS